MEEEEEGRTKYAALSSSERGQGKNMLKSNKYDSLLSQHKFLAFIDPHLKGQI